MQWLPRLLLLTLLGGVPGMGMGSDLLRIACASNFHSTLDPLVRQFGARHPAVRITISSASSGQLYHQIRQGAPFDLFLSADERYTRRLHRQRPNLARPRTYALGRLAFWRPAGEPDPRLLKRQPLALALANPATAPYGQAAREVLEHLGVTLGPAGGPRLIRANNVSQATQFVEAGAAEAGLVALSLLPSDARHYRRVPEGWHAPLRQQLLVLDPDHDPARAFARFLLSPDARERIAAAGYRAPPTPDPHHALAQ